MINSELIKKTLSQLEVISKTIAELEREPKNLHLSTLGTLLILIIDQYRCYSPSDINNALDLCNLGNEEAMKIKEAALSHIISTFSAATN